MEERARLGLKAPVDSVEGFYREVWHAHRKQKGTATFSDDEARFELHILPVLGHRHLEDLRVHDVLEVIARMKTQGLAPRTIRNAVGVLRIFFRDAKRRALIDSNPCDDLERGEVPPAVDADPEWREQADFERHELEHLCFSPKVPFWRRIDYAMAIFTGTRDGERYALRWRHYDAGARPLGKLAFVASYNEKLAIEKETKTGVARYVPVHPVLAAMLAEWRETGWAEYLGRKPTADDLVLPFRRRYVQQKFKSDPERRTQSAAWDLLQDDLKAAGWRGRRMHDLRTAMINLAIEDGANELLIKRLTHLKRSEAFDVYKRNRWPLLCAEISKITLGYTLPAVTAAVTARVESAGLYHGGSERPPQQTTARLSQNSRGKRSAQPEPARAVTSVTDREWVLLDRAYLAFLQAEGEA